MLSFYGTPVDDLDAAIAADPHWLLPRVMKAGFLLNLTEPVARRRGAGCCSMPPSHSSPGRTSASAATSPPCARSSAATGRAPPTPGARSFGTRRATCWRCSGRCCSTSTAAMPTPCASASPRSCRPGARPIRSIRYVLGHHAFGLEESGRLRRGRGRRPRGARRLGARALGDPRRRPRHGDAGPARRGRRLDGLVAAVLGPGQRLRRAPRLARGAVRARGARPCRGAGAVRPLPPGRGERDHAAAARCRLAALAAGAARRRRRRPLAAPARRLGARGIGRRELGLQRPACPASPCSAPASARRPDAG